MTDMFEIDHNASSARHAYEQHILLEAQVNKQKILADRAKNIADRAQNPNPRDVCHL